MSEENAMDKALPAVMGGILGLALFIAVAGMVQATTPTPQYTCPLCGLQFFTYDELYSHFTTEHPAEDIEIIWE